jgi:predicted MFS family arabinose efflux permease
VTGSQGGIERDDAGTTPGTAAGGSSDAEAVPRRWRDDVRLLREHDLGLLVASRLVSDFGNGVAPIALAFGVLALPGGDAGSLGLVLLCAALPRIVFMLVGGVLADRVRSRSRLMASTEIIAATTQLLAAALFLSGHATVPTLAAIAVVNGAAVAVFYPTMTGLIPQLASGAALQSANALVRLSSNIAGILGTAIGGILVATVGAGWALLIDAATYALSAMLLWLVRARSSTTPDDDQQSVIDDMVHGWREFTARRWVWLMVVLFSISNVGFTMAIDVLGPVRSLESWDGPRGWAVVLVSFSVGTVLGVVVAMRIRPSRPLLVAMTAEVFVAFPVLAMAPPAPLVVVAVLGFVSGVCIDVFEVLWQTTLQQQIPAESLSRVSSYDLFGSLSLTPLALLAAGALESWLGLEGALWVCWVLGAASSLAILDPSVRGVRSAPTST